MNLPLFLTFTGVDDYTDLHRAKDLSLRYPIEWGVLFSPTRQGIDGRYPSPPRVFQIARMDLRLSAHLCGSYARNVKAGKAVGYIETLIGDNFRRAQINSSQYLEAEVSNIEAWGRRNQVQPIIQARDKFPSSLCECDVLLDSSGGKGLLPDQWAPTTGTSLQGYAGGLSPTTIAEALAQIGNNYSPEHPYWMDMETGVRDSRDRFDLDKVEEVCQIVYDRKVVT